MDTIANGTHNNHSNQLSHDQQAYCERNPTYALGLVALNKLHTEISSVRDLIADERSGRLPELPDLSLDFITAPNRRTKEVDDHERDLKNLEGRLRVWRDELAELATALLARPKFSIVEDVVLIDGSWYWPLPTAKRESLGSTRTDSQHAMEPVQSGQPKRGLSRILPSFLQKKSKGAKIAKKARVVDRPF